MELTRYTYVCMIMIDFTVYYNLVIVFYLLLSILSPGRERR